MGSQRPKILAWCTSQAAKYASAPPRSYSCSTSIARAAAGGSVGWQRQRHWIEVFSSAETTYSSSASSSPCHSRAYRSSTRAALASKSGARGKIQLRCAQGRIASVASQRQIVVPEISATRPRAMTSVRMSGTNSRDSGRPSRLGSSQAIALTWMATSGGKGRGSSAAGTFLQAGQPLGGKALAPLGDDLPAGVQPRGDLVVV